MEIFSEITIVLLIATALSFVMRFLKQPLIVGYILAGIVVGPSVLNLIHAQDTVELFSKLGITILLFIVGLHMSPKVVKEIGSISLITGVGQVVFTSVIGFFIALYLGIDRLAALYVAIALTFSSTIIILKLLSDKGAVQMLYGKIAIGFLLVQDVIATIILIVVSSLNTESSLPLALALGLTLLKGIALLIGLFAATKWVLPKIALSASANTELLFLFSLSWGLSMAVLFYLAGLSIEIGALVAGVALSALPYADEISSRLRPLRDFFIILFFIFLGSHMTLGSLGDIWFPALVLSLFVLIGNPVIVIVLMNLLGHHRKTGFMAGLTVAQISEFSLILAALGLQVGHITPEILTLVTLVGLITIAGSTYLILYSEPIYARVSSLLRYLELRNVSTTKSSRVANYEVFLFGFNRTSKELLHIFSDLDLRMAVVDFDPNAQDRLPSKKIGYFYGDAGSAEFLAELPLDRAKIIVSSIPDLSANKILLRQLHQSGSEASAVFFAQNKDEAMELYQAGASYVMVPHHLAGKHLSKLIARAGLDRDMFRRKQVMHEIELKTRTA
jgi:Kef-type K+ transport system membrane component KefB